MKFKIEKYSIKQLIDLYEQDMLNLKPPYQRNPIWSDDAKKSLIETINNGYPIPNLFLHLKDDKKYDMVDGQQRTRSILSYYKGDLLGPEGKYYDKTKPQSFLTYELAVIVITDVTAAESMEHFYALVNKSGLRLNRPELVKAEYFDTRFLQLVEELTSDEQFKQLDLFSKSSLMRMNDADLVSELLGLLILGITDKKLGVDNLLKEDITVAVYKEVKSKFKDVIALLSSFNEIYPLSDTRYWQRNDLYTLFGFLSQHSTLKQATLEYFYRILVLIGEDIFPTQDKCLPFKDYAYHCVTQSNSKLAREKREQFLIDLFLNKKKTVNDTQRQILHCYKLKKKDIERVEGFTEISAKKLQLKVGSPSVVS
jgi:hypothetical protein